MYDTLLFVVFELNNKTGYIHKFDNLFCDIYHTYMTPEHLETLFWFFYILS